MKQFLQNKAGLALIFLISSCSAFAVPLINFSSKILTRDWGLFNANSLFINSSVLNYGKLPLQNPYLLGGMDVAANPQSRVFSPLVIFDLLFSAPYANLLSLVFLSFIGSFGIYFLLKFLKINRLVSIVVAVMFVHASWFHLHFSEGHIIFGSFLLFGWVIYFILRLEEPKFKYSYAALSAFMLLDGGIYPFIYAQLLLFFMLLFEVNGISFVKLFKSIFRNKKHAILSVFVFVGLSSFKLIPLLMSHINRTPILENINLDLSSVMHSFFNPFAFVRLEIVGANFSNFINFIELGAYFGVIAFLVIIYFLFKHWNKSMIGYILVILMFLWMASGWFDPINPWRLFQKLPVVNNAHIQTRGLFIVYLFILILLAFGLNNIFEKRKTIFVFLVLILLFEAQWTSIYPYKKVYEMADCTIPVDQFPQKITFTTIEKTVETPISSSWGFDFLHYNSKNIAVKWFMDPTAQNTNGNIKTTSDKDYKSEVYFIKGNGKAEMIKYVPNEVELNVDVKKGAIVQLNSNYLHGWVSNKSNCKVFEKNGLITLYFSTDFKGNIMLNYRPTYFWWCAALTFSGLFVLIFGLRKHRISGVNN